MAGAGTSGPYGATILEHFRRPRNQGRLPNADASAEGANPLCGDRVRIELRLATDSNSIADAKFSANACAICVAAASLLTDRLRGLRISEAVRLTEPDVLAALDAEIGAGRRRCATLPLEAAHRALAPFGGARQR